MKLVSYLKDQGFTTASKVVGPNGAFISASGEGKKPLTIPVGKTSQDGKLADYNVLTMENGGLVASLKTQGDYKTEEVLSL